MREKLIELLKEAQASCRDCDECEHADELDCYAKHYADVLIANGVTVREKGEWIRQDNTYTRFMCSACGSKNHEGGQNYCSHCGADMRGDT